MAGFRGCGVGYFGIERWSGGWMTRFGYFGGWVVLRNSFFGVSCLGEEGPDSVVFVCVQVGF